MHNWVREMMRAMRKMVWEGYLLGLTMVYKELYTGLTRLAITLEREVFPLLQQRGIQEATLKMEDGAIKLVPAISPIKDFGDKFKQGVEEALVTLPLSGRIARFFMDMGIKGMRLDTLLEYNQLVDIFRTIHGIRSITGRKVPGLDILGRAEKVELLLGDGYNDYCAITRFSPSEGILSIKYHYCELKYSRATKGLKKGSEFHDHRFFFHNAPRYGIASGLVVMALVIVSSYLPSYLSITLSIIIGLLAGLAVFLAFQTIGSLEYDKEHLEKRIGGG